MSIKRQPAGEIARRLRKERYVRDRRQFCQDSHLSRGASQAIAKLSDVKSRGIPKLSDVTKGYKSMRAAGARIPVPVFGSISFKIKALSANAPMTAL